MPYNFFSLWNTLNLSGPRGATTVEAKSEIRYASSELMLNKDSIPAHSREMAAR
jgi:hypothetical protein